jgi:hypothetical protein
MAASAADIGGYPWAADTVHPVDTEAERNAIDCFHFSRDVLRPMENHNKITGAQSCPYTGNALHAVLASGVHFLFWCVCEDLSRNGLYIHAARNANFSGCHPP